MSKCPKRKGEVIEIYRNGAEAAVRFKSGRVECVLRAGMQSDFYVGQRGWTTYHLTVNGSRWGFEPFKNQGVSHG